MLVDYTSRNNGYRGVLDGKSTLRIFDPNGHEVLHTYFRAGDTLEYLKEVVDTADKLTEMLHGEADDGQSEAD